MKIIAVIGPQRLSCLGRKNNFKTSLLSNKSASSQRLVIPVSAVRKSQERCQTWPVGVIPVGGGASPSASRSLVSWAVGSDLPGFCRGDRQVNNSYSPVLLTSLLCCCFFSLILSTHESELSSQSYMRCFMKGSVNKGLFFPKGPLGVPVLY